MLKRDYILQLIREFFAALQRALEKKEIEDRRKEILSLYEKYVGPFALYHDGSLEDVLKAIAGMDEEKRLPTMEILAELYYAEADTVGQPDRDFLLDKAYNLFELVDRNGRTYSFDRLQKMNDIKKKIGRALTGR